MFFYPHSHDPPANASVETITIIPSDVRTLPGKLAGRDQTPNLAVSHTIERIFASPDRKRQRSKLPGLYLICGGDIVALSRHVDVRLGVGADWSVVKAERLT